MTFWCARFGIEVGGRPNCARIRPSATPRCAFFGLGWPVAWVVVSDRITPEAVAKVAKLARLNLSDTELDQATHQLSDMLDHFADIDALDLGGVEPMTHPTPIANVMREDIEMDCLDRDEVLAAAPAAENGRFRVPPILGLED